MILITFSAIHLQCSTTTSTMASTSQTNPTYDVPSFNTHDRLVTLHQEITDFLHYQSHIWYTATTSLPPNTSTANQRERATIIEFLKEECTVPASRCSNDSLRWPTTMLPSSTRFSRTRQSTTMSTGEKSTGDQRRNGNNHCCHKMNDISANPSASCSNC